ncbi:MAG TPA: hypothetical protein VF032_14305 [Thermoleophilaceae bacterium]
MAGVVFVAALVAESVVSFGVGLAHDDPAAKVARHLAEHHRRLVAIACLSVVYAPMFVIYLTGLHGRLRGGTDRSRLLSLWVLVGGSLMIAMHAVSDIGITGLLGAKVATYSVLHDPGLSYTLYYLTFAVDSVGDVFGSVFLIAAGVLAIETGVLPRWLGRIAVFAGALLFLQGFGLGGVIGTFGLVLDGIGFVLFLIFVLASSVILLRRPTAPDPSAGSAPR